MAETLDALFRPRSVAVVGASRKAGGLGRAVLDNLRGQYAGRLYAVNASGAGDIAGVPCFPTVAALPEAPDLAVLAVPAEAALEVAEACGRRGVKALVVLTAGFREVGGEGAAREARLVEVLRRHGMRAVGPNCMGILNSDPAVRLNATFAPAGMAPGDVAFVSQSGALGMAILEHAEELGLGLSYFVSLGNKANLSTNDLLVAWEHDDRVRLILLYLENFGNPRKFVDLARRIAPRKPILAVKSGRTAAGARAARSHTGALAEADVLTDALFEQCGVLRVRTIEELFVLARVFDRAPLPRGRRVAVVTNSGGPGIMAADALLEAGLAVAALAPETTARLRTALLPEATVDNPVDVIAGGGPDHVAVALDACLADPGVDAVLCIYTPPVFVDEHAVVKAILGADRRGKPLLACVLGRSGQAESFRRLTEAGVPTFTYPETAVRGLAAYVAYAERQRRPAGTVRRFPADLARARELADPAMPRDDGWLAPEAALELLATHGLPVAHGALARTATEAAEHARRLGFPVALKVVAPGVLHKSDVGGVALGLRASPEVAQAFEAMRDRVAARGHAMQGALVQAMAPPGREVILGASVDPKFGPLLMFGLGGTHVEVLRDVVFRLAPLTDEEAKRMVRAIRGWPLLEGVRGEAPADVAAIEDALLRLSQLVADLPAVAEVDVNPLIVGPAGKGAVAADARVRLWPDGAPPRAPAVLPELPRPGPGRREP